MTSHSRVGTVFLILGLVISLVALFVTAATKTVTVLAISLVALGIAAAVFGALVIDPNASQSLTQLVIVIQGLPLPAFFQRPPPSGPTA